MIYIKICLRRDSDLKKICQILENYRQISGGHYLSYNVMRYSSSGEAPYRGLDYGMSHCEDKELDLMISDLQEEEDITYLKEVRKRYPQVELMVISRSGFPAEACVIPEIRPALLLKRPLDMGDLKQWIGELCQCISSRKGEEKGCFTFRENSLRRRIPYSMIQYYETINKKVRIYSVQGMYEFYDSFCRIQDELPEEFVRCHRSFIVNTSYVTGINLEKQYIMLSENNTVPISKKYRNQVENYIARCV